MGKAAVMVAVQVGEDDSFHISRPDAQRAQLRADFLIPLDAKGHFPAHVRMQGGRGLKQVRALAGVDHDHAFRMLDDPRIAWKPLRPVSISEDRKPSS